jgi:hypothetical protein
MTMKYAMTLLLILAPIWSVLHAEKYAGELFRMGAGIRNEALGRSGVSDLSTLHPAYWNASLLKARQGTDLELSHSEEFDGLLTYDVAAFTLDNRFSVSFMRIGIEDVPLTRAIDPSDTLSNMNRPYQYDSVTNADYVVYLGFERDLGGIPLGISPKFAYRSLAKHSGYGFGADVSTHFILTPNWLVGLRLRDCFSTQVFWENGTHETVNPGLDVDSNVRFHLPVGHFASALMVGAALDSEGRDEAADVSMGALSADFHGGLAITLHPDFDLLAGYDSDNITAGCTLRWGAASLNYAFEHDPDLENSHRIGLGWSFR